MYLLCNRWVQEIVLQVSADNRCDVSACNIWWWCDCTLISMQDLWGCRWCGVFPFSREGRYGEVFSWSVPTCTLDHTLGLLPACTCYSNHRCDIRSACLNFTEVWAKSSSSSWKLMSGIRFLGGWESVCVWGDWNEVSTVFHLIAQQWAASVCSVNNGPGNDVEVEVDMYAKRNSCYRGRTVRVSEGEFIYISQV